MWDIFSFTAFRQISQMLFAIFFFHSSEFLLAVYFHGIQKVTPNTLLLSIEYVMAMIFSLVEYLVEIHFFPEMKEQWAISNMGLALLVVGEIIRKLAIITAGRSFTHLIKKYIDDDHVLITHGLYKYVRHPSYCGFFLWSIGTQIMLCNPLCTLAFALVVWKFFHMRIPYEEFFLRQYFGSQYEAYARRTSSGIPFIK
ncbi:protein-S-isoprenylcysteine O-methyltransferase A-like [Salvia splendens]|uniref:protein-S-isoprenylcysteine O-methyltransferase A-like n=1 Tax=Salvia splendens TaxID=180675 RepID=UPI001C272A22|nr:protein-S-isoprenylcysteine O-methyltransferase A-like [Salvia splendens]XP_042063766.1 protein-S-isoprenylcysteine O-methyltransferase A-like [Salvia splendens]